MEGRSSYAPTLLQHSQGWVPVLTWPAPLLLCLAQWLMDHGREEEVWQLSNKKAKKADWEAAVRRGA